MYMCSLFYFLLVSTFFNHAQSSCSFNCVHGICFNSSCICELGWTGSDCNTDCGCNGHSSCSQGILKCDECKNNTTGQYCQICKSGYFWSEDNSKGCLACNCNGHGDPDQNFCNVNTGTCICIHNTEGPHCEKCSKGFYGEPQNNGHCYQECSNRGLITSIKSGYLGSLTHSSSFSSTLTSPFPSSSSSSSSSYHCLWILTIYPSLELLKSSLSEQTNHSFSSDPIALTIDQDIDIDCSNNNNLEVYDGLPDYILSSHKNKKLGSFCGQNLKSDINLIATSGYLTIYYEKYNSSKGFNASFIRLECPETCLNYPNRKCVNGSCVCKDGYAGPFCFSVGCPNQCYQFKNQGVCDTLNGRCQCMVGYAQPDCSVYIGTSSYNIVWTTYFESESAAKFLPLLASNLPRMGHSLISINESLWLFGGYSSQKGELNDIYLFNLPASKWEEIEIAHDESKPLERHFHATAVNQDVIFIHGGLSLKNGVLSDLWCFQTSTRTWFKPVINSELPPPLAGHTLTKASDDHLYMIGGYSPSYGFSEQIYAFDSKQLIFKTIATKGLPLVGIYGHTSTYHPLTGTIYVYGGITHTSDGTTVSSNLYALKISTSTWFRLLPDTELNPIFSRPIPRYFHSAISTENYMLIIGGRDGSKNGKILRNMFAYVFKCNLWINLDKQDMITTSGVPPTPALGAAMASTSDSHIYLFGGINGVTLGRLVRLSLPKDICHLFSDSRTACVQHAGCNYCKVYVKDANKTICFSNCEAPASCSQTQGASEVTSSVTCDSKLLGRNCKHYKTCTDCLTYFPTESDTRPLCQWCPQCSQTPCIFSSSSSACDNQKCKSHHSITSLNECPIQSCNAFDCEKCLRTNGSCIWSTQSKISNDLDFKTYDKTDLKWRCVKKDDEKLNFACPRKCYQYQSCGSCLKNHELEINRQECSWSVSMKECIALDYIKLRCEGGLCGNRLFRRSSTPKASLGWNPNHLDHLGPPFISSLFSKDKCSSECSDFVQSIDCLSLPHCGWCAFNGSSVNGQGLCMTGGLTGPTSGICNIHLFRKPSPQEITHWLSQSEGSPKWYYLTRPKEDECSNGHHTCDKRFETCIDLEEGFNCECKTGYKRDGNRCKPICLEGCVHGVCVEPNICQCHFGFVGKNCSIECKCNGHSNCAGINRLTDCLECHNNTQGPQCQFCKPYFVESPMNSGKCISCKEFCNHQSDLCFSRKIQKRLSKIEWNKINSPSDLDDLIQKGSTMSDTICHKCKHNTKGDRCNECIFGYFKSDNYKTEGCIKCNCNGHADYCDPLSGDGCACSNNTESERQCSSRDGNLDLPPCWKTQCIKCKDTYTGQPTDHHQCYKHMYLDREYCFNPESLLNCDATSNVLLKGNTVYYAVIPRYMNVDIRIVIDVSFGVVDFYFAFKDDIFVVDSNFSQTHQILFDSKYTIFEAQNINDTDHLINQSFKSQNLKLKSVSPNSLNTYIRVSSSNELFKIDSLKNRLVITIPHQVHDLRSTRFYLILKGLSNLTFGALSFRQDQSRIDLFVFFSVFFSSFFLFLTFCILTWKFKRTFDIRRARRLHAAEMRHMASRPFSSLLVYLDPILSVDSFDYALSSPVRYYHDKKYKTGFKWKGSHSNIKSSTKYSTAYQSDNYLIRPVSVEPTWDGVAAVVTTLMILPGDRSTPVRMTLATSLVSIKSSHQLLNCYDAISVNMFFRSAMRCRLSN